MIKIEILSQGEELLTGQVVDTNASWLSDELVRMGLTITRHTTVGDDKGDLVAVLKEIAVRADGCLCTGGLGPTVDDLTAEAVAEAFALPLKLDTTALAQIEGFFEHRGQPMPASNRKQALLPTTATRLDNLCGTAPGFSLEHTGCWFGFMPGVPYEMKQLFNNAIRPVFLQRFPERLKSLVIINTLGLGESDLQDRIQSIVIPNGVRLGFLTAPEGNQIKLLFDADFPQGRAQGLIADFKNQLGASVFSVTDDRSYQQTVYDVVGEQLINKGLTLAVLETLTQGEIASQCLGKPWLLSAVYCQDLIQLARFIGMDYLAKNSDKAWCQLAQNSAEVVRRKAKSDYGLAQLCFNNKIDGSPARGTIYTALVTATTAISFIDQVGGSLRRQQRQSALKAFDRLRIFLQENN
ncbi:MAG TPA: competence/damage-inducible protein A [Methylococcales bacterium]|nr:competence/damage-inducible protein A [Methylococcales bacterium]